MTLKQKIIQYSQTLDVDVIGFCDASPFRELKKLLDERDKNGFRCELEKTDVEKMIYPEKTMPNAKSFIVIAEGYSSKEQDKKDGLIGYISPSATTVDYHELVMNKLKSLEAFIHKQRDCQTECFVDISPFSDRAIAERAGLGYAGYNSMLISEKLGTRFFIGYILTDLEIKPDNKEFFSDCSSCNLCIKACPTGALKGGGLINANQCISYLTQSKKEIPSLLKKKMGRQLYGCDRCQEVCPKNKGLMLKPTTSIIPSQVELEDILNLSNKAFRETYARTASGWRGKKLLQRNAIIALGNSKDIRALKILKHHIEDRRPDIRKEIIDAIKRLGFTEGIELLQLMKNKEKVDDLLPKIDTAIEEMRKN